MEHGMLLRLFGLTNFITNLCCPTNNQGWETYLGNFLEKKICNIALRSDVCRSILFFFRLNVLIATTELYNFDTILNDIDL